MYSAAETHLNHLASVYYLAKYSLFGTIFDIKGNTKKTFSVVLKVTIGTITGSGHQH